MQLNKGMVLTIAMALFSGVATAQKMTAEQVVKKHIDAIGGTENWKKVNSLKKTGILKTSMNVDMGSTEGQDIEVTTTILNGKGLRQDINLGGTNNYVIMTPTGGWTFFSGQLVELTADDVKGGLDQLSTREEFMNWMSNGAQFKGGTIDSIDNKAYYKIVVISSSSDTTLVYIDPVTYYTYKTVASVSGPDGVTQINTTYTNYQTLPEGIVVAMNVNSDELGGETIYKTIEVNTIKDERIFQKQ